MMSSITQTNPYYFPSRLATAADKPVFIPILPSKPVSYKYHYSNPFLPNPTTSHFSKSKINNTQIKKKCILWRQSGGEPEITTFRRWSDPVQRVVRLASESAVVIFSVSSCCMCHAVKRLFCGIGVNPTVYELDQDPRGKEMEWILARLVGSYSGSVPVVFIGGKLIVGMYSVMGSHINGSLVPLLKEAGALWL